MRVCKVELVAYIWLSSLSMKTCPAIRDQLLRKLYSIFRYKYDGKYAHASSVVSEVLTLRISSIQGKFPGNKVNVGMFL